MFNTIKFGNRIAEKRRKAGFTQEELVERVGDENISVSTLKRIESGHGHIDMVRIIRICKALGIELSDLIGENMLKQAIENWFDVPDEENEVQDRLYRQRLFYPELRKDIYYDMRPIKTLMQFIIYLPLMDETLVLESLRRIEGDVFDSESYVLDKLWYLYRNIPDSKAKHYADYVASKCTYEYFVEYYTNDPTEADKIWLDQEKCDEMLACHDEYVELIEKKWKKVLATAFPQE